MNHLENNSKLKKILSSKASTQQLAQFYIVETNGIDLENYSFNWVKNLIEEVNSISNCENNGDVLLLNNENPKEKYLAEDISLIHQFMVHRSVELNQKYLIINNAHLLSELLANKLLKTFEEPPIKLTVFLINNHRVHLLPTISSRGINLKLQIPIQAKKQILAQIQEQDISFLKFCEIVDQEKCQIHTLLSELLELYASKSDTQHKDLLRVQKELMSIEQDLIYNNSINSMRLKIYNLAKQPS